MCPRSRAHDPNVCVSVGVCVSVCNDVSHPTTSVVIRTYSSQYDMSASTFSSSLSLVAMCADRTTAWLYAPASSNTSECSRMCCDRCDDAVDGRGREVTADDCVAPSDDRTATGGRWELSGAPAGDDPRSVAGLQPCAEHADARRASSARMPRMCATGTLSGSGAGSGANTAAVASRGVGAGAGTDVVVSLRALAGGVRALKNAVDAHAAAADDDAAATPSGTAFSLSALLFGVVARLATGVGAGDGEVSRLLADDRPSTCCNDTPSSFATSAQSKVSSTGRTATVSCNLEWLGVGNRWWDGVCVSRGVPPRATSRGLLSTSSPSSSANRECSLRRDGVSSSSSARCGSANFGVCGGPVDGERMGLTAAGDSAPRGDLRGDHKVWTVVNRLQRSGPNIGAIAALLPPCNHRFAIKVQGTAAPSCRT